MANTKRRAANYVARFSRPPKRYRRMAPVQNAPRAGYNTVPRSRGVYATGEMKYFDTEATALTIAGSTNWTGTEYAPNVGTPNTFFAPTTGSAINQRIGRKVKVYKIRVHGNLYSAEQTNQTTADIATNVRILLVQDCQTNGAQAQGEDIMAAATTGSALNQFNAFQSLASLGRFKVLKDKIFTFGPPTITYDGTNLEQFGQVKSFKFDVKFRNPVEVNFNATNGGTISDIVDNSWCIYATVSTGAVATSLYYSARVYYKE